MRIPSRTFLPALLVLTTATLSSAPQSDYAVPAPIAPTSYQECDNFNTLIQQRLEQLQRAAQQCDKQIHNSCVPPGYHLGAALQCVKENGGIWAGAHFENTECGRIMYEFPRCRIYAMRYECLSKSHWDQVNSCRAKVDAYRQSQRQQQSAQEEVLLNQANTQRAAAQKQAEAQTAAIARGQARAQAVGTIGQAVSVLLSKAPPSAPPESQKTLTEYEAAKSQLPVIGDDAKANLQITADVAQLAGSGANGKDKNALDKDLDALTGDEKNSGVEVSDDTKNGAYDIEEKIVGTGVREAESAVESDLDVARKVLSGKELESYEKEAEHSGSFIQGLDRALVAVKYGKDIGTIIVAEDERERNKASSDMFRDLVKDGFTAVAKRLSTRLGTFLEGPWGWVIGSTLESTEVGLDPVEIVNDTSGKYGFTDKQKALDTLILQYNNHRDIWGQAQVQWLMQTANKIYSSPDNPNIHLVPR